MYKDKSICLVIPAYNEERLIKPTLADVPNYVDKVYVIDDGSTDGTVQVVSNSMENDGRIELLRHERNIGPGQAIITGYKRASKDDYDIAVVVGGDDQMPLAQMSDFLDPLVAGEADYTKGNRFLESEVGRTMKKMPKTRLIGNVIITALTKISSGYYKLMDVVDGYTAITNKAIDTINWDKAWKKYGYPMDFLIRLNAYGFRVKDIPRKAIYLENETQSKIKGLRYALRVSPMLFRGFLWRLTTKYIYRDFHPLVFFYFSGMVLLPLGILFGFYLIYQQVVGIGVSGPRAILCALFMILGLQFLLFAMLFDMEQAE